MKLLLHPTHLQMKNRSFLWILLCLVRSDFRLKLYRQINVVSRALVMKITFSEMLGPAQLRFRRRLTADQGGIEYMSHMYTPNDVRSQPAAG